MKSIILSTFILKSLALNKLYPLSDFIDEEALTTPVVENSAFGTCPCDLTTSSCDTYCCCDTDCSHRKKNL